MSHRGKHRGKHHWYLAWVGIKSPKRYVVCSRCGHKERVHP